MEMGISVTAVGNVHLAMTVRTVAPFDFEPYFAKLQGSVACFDEEDVDHFGLWRAP